MTLTRGSGDELEGAAESVSDPHVTSYCQRLDSVLNLSKETHRQLRQSMINYRHACPDKFSELLRVHLSFLVDLPHFDRDCCGVGSLIKSRKRMGYLFNLSSPLRFRERGYILSRSSSGQHLCQSDLNRIKQLIDFLTENERYRTEGLFRKTGNYARQKVLHRQLTAAAAQASSCGGNPLAIPEPATVHDAANVLKMLLRGGDREASIFSSGLANLLLAIAELTSAQSLLGRTESERQLARCRQRRALRLFHLLLPETNACALLAVLRLLSLVAASPETRMSVQSLGTVFGPVLLGGRRDKDDFQSLERVEKLNEAVALLIANCSLLSQIPLTFAEDAAGHWSALLLLVPESAGSPVRFTRRVLPGSSAMASDTAAALRAHICRMPDSRRKRQLEKRLAEQAAKSGKTTAQELSQSQHHQSMQKRLRLRSWTRLANAQDAEPDRESLRSDVVLEDRQIPLPNAPSGRSLSHSLGSVDSERQGGRTRSRRSRSVANADKPALTATGGKRTFLETAL